MKQLIDVDPEIAKVLRLETTRRSAKLELIASENFVSEAVLEAMGSLLTNKYAEGYPGKRYYGDCEFVDLAETLAIERAKQLFGADHVNVQPHSGAQANMLVDVASKVLTGKVAEAALDKAGLTVNKDAIPFDTKPPTITSGIRLGTPALTTRGMRQAEMRQVAGFIAEVLADVEDADRQARVPDKVREMGATFPLYRERLLP